MISTGDHQFGVGQLLRDRFEGLDHEFKAFVGSPFTKGKDAVGSASPGEIREFRAARKNAMRAQVDVIASVLVIQNLAVAGHEHGNGI